MKKIITTLIATAIIGFIYFYLTLPAINLQSIDFYYFLITIAAIYLVIYMFLNMGNIKVKRVVDEDGNVSFKASTDDQYSNVEKDPYLAKKRMKDQKFPIYIIVIVFAIIIIGSFVSSPIFYADSYTRLINIEAGNFEEDIDELSYDQIPWLDKASAERLGDRKLGELADMVSQFEVSTDYVQINYRDRPVRVTPLLYGDVFKWLNNYKEGLPGYVVIDMVTQDGQVVRTGEGNGIKYSNSEYFFRNIMRHIRFNYPTYMFEQPVFEIDDEGNPYWICPKVVKKIGLFGGTDIDGIVVVNAITGDHVYYANGEVPQWIDNVYRANLIIQQYDYYGAYQGGFLNSIFGQQGVTMTSAGYNYLAMDDDVYMYTGITSVGKDESNIGFIWVNQRTKETKYYQIAGAQEFSAMNSSQGAVQDQRYVATFPLLLNINGQPTYFMALKDDSNLVKQYAMVNVQQHQIVAIGPTVLACEENYIKRLADNDIAIPTNTEKITGMVEDIRTAVIGGNTHYYVKLSGAPTYYSISAGVSPNAALINVGDQIVVKYTDTDTRIKMAQSFEWVS